MDNIHWGAYKINSLDQWNETRSGPYKPLKFSHIEILTWKKLNPEGKIVFGTNCNL